MNINQITLDFVGTVIKTREFIELKQAQAQIDKNPELKNKVEEFKKRQQEIWSANKYGKEAEFKISELNKNFQSLSKNPEVDSYLTAGKNFQNLLLKVFKTINDSIESELRSK